MRAYAFIVQEAEQHIDIYRRVYNRHLYVTNHEYDDLPNMTTLRSQLPNWKSRRPEESNAYSKLPQTVVGRLYNNLNGLQALKQRIRCR